MSPMDTTALAFDLTLQWKLLFYSLIVGGSLGVFFDILRFTRAMLRVSDASKLIGKVSDITLVIVSFIEDILFFSVSAVTLVLFVFKANDGRFRSFVLIGTLVGFFLYLGTVGRLTRLIFDVTAKIVWAILNFIFTKIIFPPLRLLKRFARFVYKFTVSRLVRFIKPRWQGFLKKLKGTRDETSSIINTGEACNIARVRIYDNHPCKRSAPVQPAGGRTAKYKNSDRRCSGKH